MKSATTLMLAVGLAWGSAGAPPGRHPANAARVSGREYVRLSDWARANGFTARWLKRDETVELSNHSSRIRLEVDSAEAVVNGVQVRLLFPMVERNGEAWLTALDDQTTFRPILHPPKNRTGATVRTICLDPGHGGKDPGFQVGSREEKHYTLLLAQEVRDQLTRAGFKVSLTRTSDAFLELPTRPDLARRRNADLFVSLHFNAVASSAGSVQGAEVYCLTPAGAPSSNARGEGAGAGWFAGNRQNDKNMFLAYQLQRALVQGLGAEDRSVHRARFAILRDAVMPGVLVEAGYMSHPAEGRKIFDAAYRKQMARAIVEGIQAYKRTVERP